MSTPTAPVTYLHKDYIPQLIALLADVQAETFGGIRIGGATGLTVYVWSYDVSGVVTRVSVKTGGFSRANRRSRHIYRNVELSHVAKSLRKLLAAKVAERAAQKLAYEAQVTVQNRAIEAGAQVRAAAERVGISHVTVEDQGLDYFRFGFRLENLTEAQALAVLAIVEGVGTPEIALIDSYREQFAALAEREECRPGRPPQQEDGGQ
jgi:hypothetical protein